MTGEQEQLPLSWRVARIGELCDLKNGRAFKPSDWTDKGLPIVRIQNLNNPEAPFNHYDGEVRDRFLIKNGSLLFAWSGTPGTSFGAHIWRGGEAVLNQHIFRVDFDEKAIDKSYFRFAINNRLIELIEKAHGGVGLRHVTKGKFEETTIPIPPLKEQRRIAARIEELFSELDKGVEALTTAREQVEAYRNAVLKAAFGGELTGGGIGTWAEYTIGQLVTDIRYGTAKKCVVDPMKTPVLRIPNIASGRIDLSDLKHTDFDDEELRKLRLEAGDILIVRSNGSASLVGLSAMVTDDAAGYAYAGYLIRLRLNRELILPQFLDLYLHSPWVRAPIERQARSSSGVHNINSDEIRAITVRVPPIEVQEQIVSVVDQLLSRIEEIQECADTEIKRSSALRQAILERAFSGKLLAQHPNDHPAVLLEPIKGMTAGRRNKAVTAEPSGVVVPFPHKFPSIPTTDLHAGIIALAYDHHAKTPKTLNTFGHVKAEKIIHLVEYHLGIDLERAPVKDAAGPNDYRRLLKVEHRANKKNWFGVQRNGKRYVFTKKHGFTHLLSTVSQALGEHAARVEALIKVFLPMDTQQAEIFATIYAAWNNLLLTGNASPSDEEIVTEARECWTESKLKIERQKFFMSLEWMKKHDLAPRGIGRVVEAKAQ